MAKVRTTGDMLTLASAARETVTSLAGDSPVLALFKEAAIKLNERQDRDERLVKLAHEITVQSKRIILLLHPPLTADTAENTLTEAKERFQKLINKLIKSIGLELEHGPAHLHSRTVAGGFQEYVVARTLLSLMSDKRIITYPEVQKELMYNITEDDQQQPLVTVLSEMDYMLGLSKLTGELMRKAVDSVPTGDIKECSQVCDVIRHLYTGFLGIATDYPKLKNRLRTTRSNVNKVEMALYTLYTRARLPPPPPPQAPQHVALPAAMQWKAPPGPTDVDDEGYCHDCT